MRSARRRSGLPDLQRVRVAQADALAVQGAAAGGGRRRGRRAARPRGHDRRLRGRGGQQRRRDRPGAGRRGRARVLRRARRAVGVAGARGDDLGAGHAAVPAAADGDGSLGVPARGRGAGARRQGRGRGRPAGRAAHRLDRVRARPRREPALARAAALCRARGVRARGARRPARRAPPTCFAPTGRPGRPPTSPGSRCCRRRGGGAWAPASPRGCSSARSSAARSSPTSTPTPTRRRAIYERLGFTELSGHDIYIDL